MLSPIVSRLGRSASRLLPGVCLIGFALVWCAETRAASPGPDAPAAVALPHAVVPRATASLWGTQETRSATLGPFKKWLGVLERYRDQRDLEAAPCPGGSCPLGQWQAFLASLNGREAGYQINAVHRYVNAERYISDERNNGTADNWATPAEFLGRGGDCEDYAIAKYLSLRQLGFHREAMRIVVLKDRSRSIDHAVLVIWNGMRWLMLDNQLRVVVPADTVAHYQPHYSINEEYWWMHKKAIPDPIPSPLIVGRPAEQVASAH